jgi:hypothetical protein
MAAAAALVLLLPPAPVAARTAPPTGNWQGTIVVYRSGVLRARPFLQLTIGSLRLGQVSARASWLSPPRCTDFLRLERARPRQWRFSIAGTIGICAGTSWIYDLTRRDARHLRLRATSNHPRFEGVVYAGTLRRSR